MIKKVNTLIIIFIISVQCIIASKNKSVKLTDRGKAFVEKFIPAIYHQNNAILKKRKHVKAIRDYYYFTGNLSQKNKEYLIKIANEYDYNDYQINLSNYRNNLILAMDELLSRVDIVPIEMVLAQAIIETAWGKSSAAQATNNYFGITYRGSKGRLVTSSGTTNYYLKSYESLEDGIGDYMHVLNTKRSYKKFREIRSFCRKNEIPLKAEILSAGLIKYSELRERYVAKVNHVIQKYLSKKEIRTTLNVNG